MDRLVQQADEVLYATKRSNPGEIGFSGTWWTSTLVPDQGAASEVEGCQNFVGVVAIPTDASAIQHWAGGATPISTDLGQLAGQDVLPLRFAAGADAVEAVERKAKVLLAQVDAYRELSSHLAYDGA